MLVTISPAAGQIADSSFWGPKRQPAGVAGLLVAHGSNYAHLKKLDIAGEPWHPKAVYYYFLPPDLMPSFVVNVTEFHQPWLDSIFCHESQFGRADQNPGIRYFFESMATRWGRWAGGRFAQAFYSPWPLSVDDVLAIQLK